MCALPRARRDDGVGCARVHSGHCSSPRWVSPGARARLALASSAAARRRGAIWKLGQESELAGLPFNMAGALQLVLLAQTVAAVPPAPCYKVSETYVRCRAYLPLSTVDLNVSVS